MNCFVTHSHTDEHVRCKIKEEAISSTSLYLIFVCFYLVFVWAEFNPNSNSFSKTSPKSILKWNAKILSTKLALPAYIGQSDVIILIVVSYDYLPALTFVP